MKKLGYIGMCIIYGCLGTIMLTSLVLMGVLISIII